MLRIDHEQTQAANEQAGPINREMRHLITSLQTHTKQLKDENARTKKKLKEAQLESGRLRAIIEQHGLRVVHHLGLLLPDPKEAVKTEQNNSVVGDTKPQQLKADPHHQGVPHHQHQQHSSTEGAAASSNQSLAANLHSDSSNDGQLVMASEGEVKAVADLQQQQQAAHRNSSSSPASSPIKREQQQQIKKESSSPLMPTSASSQALEIELTVEPSELAEFFEQGPGGGGSIGSSGGGGGGGSDSATLTANSSGSGGGSSAAAAAAAAALAAAEAKLADAERQLREVKSQLKKSTEERRELKLLLDGYKMADKDKR